MSISGARNFTARVRGLGNDLILIPRYTPVDILVVVAQASRAPSIPITKYSSHMLLPTSPLYRDLSSPF